MRSRSLAPVLDETAVAPAARDSSSRDQPAIVRAPNCSAADTRLKPASFITALYRMGTRWCTHRILRGRQGRGNLTRPLSRENIDLDCQSILSRLGSRGGRGGSRKIRNRHDVLPVGLLDAG